MTNPATPKLLSLIRKIREERRSEDLTQLTDAELVAKLVRALSNDNGDERLIACAVAVKWMASHARRDQRDGDLERALELLQEAGYSEFSLGQLAAVRQSATFRELRDLWGRRSKDLRQAERVEICRTVPQPIDRGGSGRVRLSLTNRRNLRDLLRKANTTT